MEQPRKAAQQSIGLAKAMSLSATAIDGVMAGKSLTQIIEALPPQERPIVQSLTFETLRQWQVAHQFIKEYVPKAPTQELDHLLSIAIVLLIGRQANMKRGYPAHTVVDEAVKACGNSVNTKYAKGLVNAVLRKVSATVSQSGYEPTGPTASNDGGGYLPPWWLAQLKASYPSQWEQLCFYQAQHPPLSLRINLNKISRSAYLALLAQAGLAYEVIPPISGHILEGALRLQVPRPVAEIPGFTTGLVSVQDAGAQLAALLLNLQPGDRVLDACAAPGGKTAHLLEIAEIDLLSLEIDPQRIGKIASNIARLGLAPKSHLIKQADAALLNWWDGQLFDKVLLDAPCSASGIVRRHPDIPFLRRENDIAQLQLKQRALLGTMWQVLKPGGLMLYVTCSLFPAEGEGQASWFEANYADALRLESVGQLLPAQTHDGFYYALFKKNGS
ncbi:MAG: 16S rRNA (cytosine(967)-C(5))-methyltransferase RsmB [Burkholderiaceae bacterium]|nr:16S rRNA (cytosine(967)-C(5))-methyltransferase RsmB [Burkholderiaceae bacterium]